MPLRLQLLQLHSLLSAVRLAQQLQQPRLQWPTDLHEQLFALAASPANRNNISWVVLGMYPMCSATCCFMTRGIAPLLPVKQQ